MNALANHAETLRSILQWIDSGNTMQAAALAQNALTQVQAEAHEMEEWWSREEAAQLAWHSQAAQETFEDVPL